MGLFDRFKNQEKGQEFFVIAGLGNPGREYAETKHNVGFCVIDRLAEKYHIDVTKFKQKALIGDGTINGKRVLLVKPQTFMNLSGESIREIVNFYKIPQDRFVVIYDDTSMPEKHKVPADRNSFASACCQEPASASIRLTGRSDSDAEHSAGRRLPFPDILLLSGSVQ